MRAVRLGWAIAAAIGVVASSPWLGELRRALRRSLGGDFALALNVALAVGAVAIGAAIVRRIRTRRLVRFAAIGAAIAAAAAWAAINRATDGDVNAVERVHFFEYGLVTWLYYRAATPGPLSIALPIAAGLLTGVADEAVQWFVPNRVGEIRDVFLNLTAIASGLLISVAWAPPQMRVWPPAPSAARAIAWLHAAVVVALAAFVHVVHGGHEIETRDVVFRSRFTAAQLMGESRDRERRWRVSPPAIDASPFSREDQYVAEAVRHVQARNTAWASDPAGAWGENLILETYFVPALDTPTAALRAPSRWPADQRADAARRVASAGAVTPYRSPIMGALVFAGPKALIWLAAAGLAGLGFLGSIVVRYCYT
jgi:hypothetical protein